MTWPRCASSAHEPAPVKWLHSDSPAGPRSPRIRSRSEAVSGPAISTEASWTNVGSLDTETRQALHEWHLLARREALASTAKHLRNQSRCREASSVTEELRAATNDILAQGSP